MTHVNACTIVSNNYLALAQVFAASYKRLHPGAEVYVCIADRPDPSVHYGRLPFVPVFAAELAIPAFENFAFRYDILELNTAVKPYLLNHLREKFGLDRIFYFDPDILMLDSVAPLERLLDEHPAVLIPHITRGLDDGLIPPERMILMAGVYNLGFLGLRLDETTAEFLSWWQDRLYRFCLNDIHNGVFVDQSWMDLAPAFLDDVAIVRDPQYNVAYWNLPQRRTAWDGDRLTADGRPVGFFHFSGIDFDNLEPISKHQNRISLTSRPELRPLFERYRNQVREAGHAQLVGIPYGFRSFPGTDVTVPWVARRLLQRMDPKGRRWPNPYDIYHRDSYFAWLVEPISCPGGALTRAALALWEFRDDLVRAFPDVCGRDLARFANWLKLHGEGSRAGLHSIFLEPVRAGAATRNRRSTFGPQLHPYATVAVEHAAELLAQLDLTRPGAMTAWLNEPIPGTAEASPVITRLALLLWKVRPDVQRSFPDPLEVHQAAFGDWFCRYAAGEFHLHADLVTPVLRTLPRKTRVALKLRREATARPEAPVTDPLLEEASAGWTDAVEREDGDGGGLRAAGAAGAAAAGGTEPIERRDLAVNLAGYFGMDTGVGQVARGSLLALREAGVVALPVPLDQDLQSRSLDGRVCFDDGAPHPVTLLHANADETPRALSMLPIAGTAGGVKIGYWFWELSHFPLSLTDRFGHLDEVWAPSRFCQRSYETVATVPVRYVPPCVPAPRALESTSANRARLGIEPGRFTFFFAFDVLSVPERKNPFAVIEAVRRLARRTTRPFSLLLKVSRARHDAALLARLRDAARGLPVEIHTTPATREQMDAWVSACDANLSLHRSEGLGLLPIETLYLGKPVVATGYGGVTDFLDETTGFPVGHSLVRLERDHSPYPAGAVWAEPDLDDAADQMLRVLEDPDEAAARGAAGKARVEAVYSVEAAAARFATEIERVYSQLLHVGPAGSVIGPLDEPARG